MHALPISVATPLPITDKTFNYLHIQCAPGVSPEQSWTLGEASVHAQNDRASHQGKIGQALQMSRYSLATVLKMSKQKV